MTKLEDRRFVTFDAVQIDVNDIVALAKQVKNRNVVDANGQQQTVPHEAAVVVFNSGTTLNLVGTSLEKFEHWWKQNVSSERAELPVSIPLERSHSVAPAVAPTPNPSQESTNG